MLWRHEVPLHFMLVLAMVALVVSFTAFPYDFRGDADDDGDGDGSCGWSQCHGTAAAAAAGRAPHTDTVTCRSSLAGGRRWAGERGLLWAQRKAGGRNGCRSGGDRLGRGGTTS